MRRSSILYLLGFVFAIGCGVSFASCKTKEGCGLEEKYAPNMDAKRKDSDLFSKKMKKRMKKGK
ncbi:MAG: hypothetical protein IPM26_11045 [Saprospiraceae bacterium]|nr:hypothetical protein [Saprospiraceae bacterium]